MIFKSKHITKGFLPLLFLLGLCACEKGLTDIGVGLRPDGGDIGSEQLVLNDISCRTIAEDSLRTDSLGSNSLGAIIDPEFGTRISSLIIQPQIEALLSDFSGSVCDSVVLTVKFSKSQFVDQIEQPLVYGDLESNMKIDVYTLGDDLVPEDKYYSNFSPTLNTYVGSYNGKFNFYDSTWVNPGTDSAFAITPEMRITLNSSFGQDILNQPSTVFATSDAFLAYLKGLVLVPDVSGISAGDGAIVGVNASISATNVMVYYDGQDSAKFPVSGVSERINLWEIQNLSSNITTQETVDAHYNTTYIQTLDGNKVHINLNQIDSIIENTTETLVINEAVLEVELDPATVTTTSPAPYRLLMAVPDEDGRTSAFIDFIDDAFPPSFDWLNKTNYGGRYKSGSMSYEFHFNRYLQQLIKEYQETGVNNFRGFYLIIPSDNPLVSSRAVLNTDPSLDGIKVSVSYTKLN